LHAKGSSSHTPQERKIAEIEPDLVDELEAGDDIEPLEEELDIIAEIGELGTEDGSAISAGDEDFAEALSKGPKKAKLKEKKPDPRQFSEELDEEEEF
jgi:DNA-directed RNA polymerase subunit beta